MTLAFIDNNWSAMAFAISLVFGMWLSVRLRKLTKPGALTGGIVGLCLFLGSGWFGVFHLLVFFGLGVAATRFQREEKQKLSTSSDNSERRTASQVLANSAAPALAACLIVFTSAYANTLKLFISGCFAAALSDTWSSELGMVWGKRFFNIYTWKPETPGEDGVVSLEGFLAGAVGSAVIGLLHIAYEADAMAFLAIFFGGMTGNLADSYLGALLERRRLMGNDMVNLLNTCIGGITSCLVYGALSP